MKAKDVRPGDTVVVRKAGDVIPEVLRPVLTEGVERPPPWKFPKVCPCGKKPQLVREEGDAAHYCHDLHCPHQKAGAIEHFASRGAIDIEGLGEETVLLLIDAGLLVDISDIYKLPPKAEELAKLEMRGTYGEAGARRLLDAIQKSKSDGSSDSDRATRLLQGLGIGAVTRRRRRTCWTTSTASLQWWTPPCGSCRMRPVSHRGRRAPSGHSSTIRLSGTS